MFFNDFLMHKEIKFSHINLITYYFSWQLEITSYWKKVAAHWSTAWLKSVRGNRNNCSLWWNAEIERYIRCSRDHDHWLLSQGAEPFMKQLILPLFTCHRDKSILRIKKLHYSKSPKWQMWYFMCHTWQRWTTVVLGEHTNCKFKHFTK